MIFQDPMMTLNPVLRIDTQMVEAVLAHHHMPRAAALGAAAPRSAASASVARRAAAQLPHQFSGGMRQRFAIAIALNAPT